jgi:hypothetical protein
MNIWSYWEGKKPDWINHCLKSLERHGGGNLSILNWEEFDKLWLEDRDLPIQDLYVVQQSDFIRAYLLHHYGGIWIDADCLIMRDLTPILKTCSLWDFMFHRQKGGDLSNAFIGAKKGSHTADHFYKGVRWRIRQPQELEWLDIGSRKMEEALNIANANNLQLAQEMVAPYDWNEGGVYLDKGGKDKFESIFNPRNLCHMLSNHGIQGYEGSVAESLSDEKSYFSYLVGKSKSNATTGI